MKKLALVACHLLSQLGLLLASAQKCPNGIHVRKEFRDMTDTEWGSFKAALNRLIATPGKTLGTTQYDEIVKVHLDNVPVAHGTPYFFTWHRAYLSYVENNLQTINANITIPYWDWAYDARNPLASPIFTEKYLGLKTGPQGDCSIQVSYPRKHCVTRNYNAATFSQFYDQNAIDMLLNSAKTMEYDTFRQWIETAPHGIVHTSIGGPKGDMTSMQSPNDPIFWLHHSQIDKLWDDFQRKSGNLNKFNGIHNSIAVSLQDDILPFGKKIRDIMDTKNLCYVYQPFSQTLPTAPKRLLALSDQPFKAPDPLPQHWIEMMHVSEEEVRNQENALVIAMTAAPIMESSSLLRGSVPLQLNWLILIVTLLSLF